MNNQYELEEGEFKPKLVEEVNRDYLSKLKNKYNNIEEHVLVFEDDE